MLGFVVGSLRGRREEAMFVMVGLVRGSSEAEMGLAAWVEGKRGIGCGKGSVAWVQGELRKLKKKKKKKGEEAEAQAWDNKRTKKKKRENKRRQAQKGRKGGACERKSEKGTHVFY